MITLILQRHLDAPGYTMGYLTTPWRQYPVMELPWRNNEPRVSRIPPGRYRVTVEPSPKFKRPLPRLHGVPGRDGILIHRGSYPRNSTGCILAGMQGAKPSNGFLSRTTEAEMELTEKIREAGEVWLEVIDAKEGEASM